MASLHFLSGILTSVKGLPNLAYGVFDSLGDFLLVPACPIEKVTRWEGLFCLTLMGYEGVVKNKVFAPTRYRTRNFWVHGPVCYPLSYRFGASVCTAEQYPMS